ncbi:MAG TPA: non-ribosomal peptide synthetase, partial [Thermoanaerobaculia bacterium]
FDAAVWELWPYLAVGARLEVPPAEVVASPPRLGRWLVERRVGVAFLPTPLAEATLRHGWPGGGALRHLLTGGDELHRPDVESLPFRLVNHYGPTEGSVVATAHPVGPGEGNPPIGLPIAGVRAWVVDGALELVPLGVPGELAVGGRGLARGYLGRPGLTADRFRPDPHSGEPGGRLYRTGDRVRLEAAGPGGALALRFLGRLDRQVKLRGFRIELGEVEAALREQPGVAEAVAAVRGDGGERRLLAWVVPADGELPVEALREALRGRLPAPMVPQRLVPVAALPLTANGKVDRDALPDPEGAAAELVAPATATERELARIWRQVLRLDQVSATDNFFDLGGHSLLLAEVQTRIEQELGRTVSMIDLFRSTTIQSLALRLADGAAAGRGVERARDRGSRQRQALRAQRPSPTPPPPSRRPAR